jgi:hypothetical protein
MWRLLLLLTFGFAIAPAPAVAQSDGWQVGATPTFSSGTYGSETRTEIVYTPIIARRLFADGDVTLVVPHLCISGDGTIAIVNGTPVGTTRPPDRSTGTSSIRERAREAATGSTRTSATSSSTASKTRTCGLGDIVVRGRYYVIDERGWLPTLALRAHVKAPTADEERGLGTGSIDEGIGLELSRMLGRGFMVMADAGYTIMGKPPGVEFRNAWWYDAGIGQDLANGAVNLSVFFEEYRAVVPSFADARGVLLALTLRSSGGWRVQLSGELGLSDGAPDHGITFGASRRF